jgi:Uma2 family endonuclease
MSIATPPLAISPAHQADDPACDLVEAGLEFANGRYVEKPVSIDSSAIAMAVAYQLMQAAHPKHRARLFDGSLGYKVYLEEPGKFRKPDVSLIVADRLKDIDPTAGFMRIPADLAVEVVSPIDLATEVMAKTIEYLQHGFSLVWNVYPQSRVVEAFWPDGACRLYRGEDEITLGAALPEFRCRISEFFPAP